MESTRLHRCAILLAAVAFLSVFTGTAVSSNEERPFYSVGQSHIWLGAAIAVLTIGLVIWIHAAEELRRLRLLGRTLLAAMAVQVFLGLQPLPQPPAIRIAHAFIGQLFFTVTGVIAVYTSGGWERKPERVEGASWLWFLAMITPAVVLAQVALGTLFRHGALGLALHLLGAFLVAMFISAMALPVIYGSEDSPLRRPAQVFLTIASVQVFLGFALFTMGSMDIDPQVMILMTMIHAAMGALTLSATVIMALLIRRHICAPQRAHESRE
jgi:heme A synthase